MTSAPASAGPPSFHFKASRQPMLWMAGDYSLGIVFGVHPWRPAAWWAVASLAFIGAATYFVTRRSGLAWLMAVAAFFLGGTLHIQVRLATPRRDTAILPFADRREVKVTAHLVKEGRIQKGSFGEIRQTLDLESEEIQTDDGKIVPVHSGIRVSISSPFENNENSNQAVTPRPGHFIMAIARIRGQPHRANSQPDACQCNR